MSGERQEIGQLSDRRECRPADQLYRNTSLVFGEIELDRLCRAREVGHAQDDLVAVFAQIGEDLAIGGTQKPERAPPERLKALAHREDASRPVEERPRRARLRLDVHHFVAVDLIYDRLEIQPLRIRAREARVALGAPLHWRAEAVAGAEVGVVAHAGRVAIDGTRGPR